MATAATGLFSALGTTASTALNTAKLAGNAADVGGDISEAASLATESDVSGKLQGGFVEFITGVVGGELKNADTSMGKFGAFFHTFIIQGVARLNPTFALALACKELVEAGLEFSRGEFWSGVFKVISAATMPFPFANFTKGLNKVFRLGRLESKLIKTASTDGINNIVMKSLTNTKVGKMAVTAAKERGIVFKSLDDIANFEKHLVQDVLKTKPTFFGFGNGQAGAKLLRAAEHRLVNLNSTGTIKGFAKFLQNNPAARKDLLKQGISISDSELLSLIKKVDDMPLGLRNIGKSLDKKAWEISRWYGKNGWTPENLTNHAKQVSVDLYKAKKELGSTVGQAYGFTRKGAAPYVEGFVEGKNIQASAKGVKDLTSEMMEMNLKLNA